MSILVDIRYVHFPAKGWRKDPRAVGTMIRAAAESGLVQLKVHTGPDDTSRPIESLDALIASSPEWQAGTHVLGNEPGFDAAFQLELQLLSTRALLMLVMPDEAGQQEGFLDRAVAFVVRLNEELGARLGCDVSVRQTTLNWPRPRPPRAPGAWTFGALVMFASRRYHERAGSDDLHELEALLKAPLPEGATREQRGDLTVWRFARSLDAEEVRAACARQERWLGQALDLPRADGWNEHGDELSFVMAQVPHEPLTYYDADRQHGYKATVVSADGAVDRELFDEIAGWLRAGALPDGTPLRAMNLIVNDRAGALAAREPASRAGIRDIYYIADGHYWNPFPAR